MLFKRKTKAVPVNGDILDHPQIARMTLRELADLPMPRPDAPCAATKAST